MRSNAPQPSTRVIQDKTCLIYTVAGYYTEDKAPFQSKILLAPPSISPETDEDFDEDEPDVIYVVRSKEELVSLLEPDNGSDFILTEIFEQVMSDYEILVETANFYNADPIGRRSVIPNEAAPEENYRCEYNGANGKHCAFGRLVKTDAESQAIIEAQNGSGVRYISGNLISKNKDLDSILLRQYQGHTVEFWEDIQQLHDRNRYWTATGLSDKGIEFYNSLKDKYAE
jgi:hypothetical protein